MYEFFKEIKLCAFAKFNMVIILEGKSIIKKLIDKQQTTNLHIKSKLT